jgi:hypothetical protein
MKPYHYVYRVSGNRGPVIKHSTVEEAVAESHRLSAQHPGEAFEILRCVAVTQTTTPTTFWNDGEEPTARYFVGGNVYPVYWKREDGATFVASPACPDWDGSCCGLDDLLNDETIREISAAQLPDPIKP